MNAGDRSLLSDNEAHYHATSLPIRHVVGELVELLGLTVVAAIGGVNETRAVTQWMQGREPQRQSVLRFALQLARMVGSGEPGLVRAWFQAPNPVLADESPTLVLRKMPLPQVQGPLMSAARQFASQAKSVRPAVDGHTA
jgi:hypothetical protein